MERHTFRKLLKIVEPHLPPGSSVNGKSLTPEERLLLFLHWASADSFIGHQCFQFRLSHGAADQNLHMVIDAIMKSVVPDYIRLPTEEEARATAQDFQDRSGGVFPLVGFGGVDGTHIEVRLDGSNIISKSPKKVK